MKPTVQKKAEGEKKYMVHGGIVISQKDRQEHYVSALRCAELYALNYKDCILIDEGDNMRGYIASDYKHLFPDWSGKYEL